MADFEIRALTEDDIPSVLELMRLALGESDLLRRVPELFRWKHFENPFGRSIMLVAETRGRIVGLRTFLRWRLIMPGGGELSCVRPVDTATHPDFQRQGIFQALTQEAVSEARSSGVDLIFNTPNKRSGAGYLKMGWIKVGEIGAMIRPKLSLRWFQPSASLPTPDQAIGGASPVAPSKLPPDRPARGLRTPRSGDYLSWRFTSHPRARFVTVERDGCVAVLRLNLRNGRCELVVSDLFGADPAAVRLAAEMSNVAYLMGWFSSGSPERKAAIRAGLIPIPGLTVLTLVARPLRHIEVDVTTLQSWDLAWSDLELL